MAPGIKWQQTVIPPSSVELNKLEIHIYSSYHAIRLILWTNLVEFKVFTRKPQPTLTISMGIASDPTSLSTDFHMSFRA